MTRLSEEEREMLENLSRDSGSEPSLSPEERFVAPTPEARARYIRFATEASMFYKGERPIGFRGNHWKL